jgi:hypothetical protein
MPYEQITRDCRILTIFEGTNEVLGVKGRNEDEEMNHLAGFIIDKGSYPWDAVP